MWKLVGCSRGLDERAKRSWGFYLPGLADAHLGALAAQIGSGIAIDGKGRVDGLRFRTIPVAGHVQADRARAGRSIS